MGIQNLLPLLSPITTDIHVSELRGQKVALDGHGFLHRGAYALDYVDNFKKGNEVQSLTRFIMFYINMLKHHKVIPIVVFDGLPLPLKADTDMDRSIKRTQAMVQAEQFYQRGNIVEANKFYHQAFSIDPDTLQQVITSIRNKDVQCIVAPYEADAQLTYLIKTNKVDAVITQDSDHLAFGCSKVIFKIDRNGNGKQIKFDDIFRYGSAIQLEHLTPTTFRHACILSGCDYLPSVRGVGIKSAVNFFRRRSSTNGVIELIKYKQPRHFPQDYLEKFHQAELGFLYQWVYDPDLKEYVRLNPVPSSIKDADLIPLGRKPTFEDLSILSINRIVLKPCSPKSRRPLSSNPSSVASASVPQASPSAAPQAPTSKLMQYPTLSEYLHSIKEDIDPNGTHLVVKDAKSKKDYAALSVRANSHLLRQINYAPNPNTPAKRRFPRTLSPIGYAAQKKIKIL